MELKPYKCSQCNMRTPYRVVHDKREAVVHSQPSEVLKVLHSILVNHHLFIVESLHTRGLSSHTCDKASPVGCTFSSHWIYFLIGM